MAGFGDGLPDWRDGGAYAPLLGAERIAFAWEWLRRDETYRRAALDALRCGVDAGDGAAVWGLHAFVDPRLPARLARPVWQRPDYPDVLQAAAVGPGAPGDCFDLERVGALATVTRGRGGREHLLLSDGLRSIRVDIIAGSVAAGPVELRYFLSGLRAVEPPLLVLRRLVALMLTGGFPKTLFPPDGRAARRVLLLRTHDAMTAGARQREIAEFLLSREAGAERWRVASPSVRSRVQRLVRAARSMRAAGYRSLLGGRSLEQPRGAQACPTPAR